MSIQFRWVGRKVFMGGHLAELIPAVFVIGKFKNREKLLYMFTDNILCLALCMSDHFAPTLIT